MSLDLSVLRQRFSRSGATLVDLSFRPCKYWKGRKRKGRSWSTSHSIRRLLPHTLPAKDTCIFLHPLWPPQQGLASAVADNANHSPHPSSTSPRARTGRSTFDSSGSRCWAHCTQMCHQHNSSTSANEGHGDVCVWKKFLPPTCVVCFSEGRGGRVSLEPSPPFKCAW